jgi:membrane-associated phospholipid phosphatase
MAPEALRRISRWDHAAMLWIREKRPARGIPVMSAFTYSGMPRAWLIGSAILWAATAQGWMLVPQQVLFLRSMLCALAAWGASSLLKRAFGRARPFQSISGYDAAVRQPECRSFPSGHAATSVAWATALLVAGHPWASGVATWALLVTLSRFYLGVHYPSDLVGGAALGALCGWGVPWLMR